MKKAGLAAMLAAVMLGATACGGAANSSNSSNGAEGNGTNASSAPPASAKPGETVEIKWLMRSNPVENKWEKEVVIPKFEKEHPNIKVNLIVVPPDQVDPKLSTMVAAGDPPDVFSMWGESGFNEYYHRDLLLDLTPYVDKDLNKSDFVDGVFDIYAVDGHYFSVPQVSNFGMMMVYNKDLFRAVGLPDLPTSWADASWTWDKMVEYAKKLTQNYGQGANAQYGVAPLEDVHTLSYLWGTSPFADEQYTTGFAPSSKLDDPQVLAALQATSDLINKDKVAPTPAETKTLEQLGNIFATGKIGMAFSLPSQAYGNLKDAPFEWGLAPLPRVADNKTSLYNGAWFIAKKSKHPDEAWELIKYLLTPENAKDMSEITGFLVPLKSATDTWLDLFREPTGMTKEQLTEVITGYPANSVENINHLFANYREINTTLTQGLDPLWEGKASAADVIEDVKPKVDAVLKRTYDNRDK